MALEFYLIIQIIWLMVQKYFGLAFLRVFQKNFAALCLFLDPNPLTYLGLKVRNFLLAFSHYFAVFWPIFLGNL